MKADIILMLEDNNAKGIRNILAYLLQLLN